MALAQLQSSQAPFTEQTFAEQKRSDDIDSDGHVSFARFPTDVVRMFPQFGSED